MPGPAPAGTEQVHHEAALATVPVVVPVTVVDVTSPSRSWQPKRARASRAAATLAKVASKKRTPGKARNKSGLSGNPQRRAQQLEPRAEPGLARSFGFGDLGALSVPLTSLRRSQREVPSWWRKSHDRAISRALGAPWPADPLGLESLAGAIVGDEFYECLQSPRQGFTPTEWLRRLILRVGDVLSRELQEPAPSNPGSWPALCSFLRGLALISPLLPAEEEEDEIRRQINAQFPDHSRPHEATLALLDHVASLPRGKALDTTHPDGFLPAGEPLVARDAYGSRFLLVCPFTSQHPDIPNGTDHCYAWDIDSCFLTDVVAAGVFGSAREALADWQAAVGPLSADAGLAPCPPDLATRLLHPVLSLRPDNEGLRGHEPRELEREQYRLRRRAQALAAALGQQVFPSASLTKKDEAAQEDAKADAADTFLGWHEKRHGESLDPAELAADTRFLIDEWYLSGPVTGQSLYSCSPHRIEVTATLFRDGYLADGANAGLRLLPDWVDWCAEQLALTGEPAARARAAARTEASRLAIPGGDYSRDDKDRPFRRPEG